MKPSRSVNKSAISTTIAVILTAIIVGSVVGGATSYLFMSRTDSTLQEVRADVKAVADAAGIPVNNPDEMKKLMEERKVIEAAKQEGKVVIYLESATPGSAAFALRSAFERKYPQITVEFVLGTAAQVRDRFLSDYEKGLKGADTIYLGQQGLLDILEKRSESLAKYVPKDTGWLPADLKDKDGRWASPTVSPYVIAYNTKLVSKAEAPKSYPDLLDPKWSGKIGNGDPKSAAVGPSIWKAMEKEFGEDFVRRLAAQKIKFYATGTLDKLATGEISIILTVTTGPVEASKATGGPVDWVRTSDNKYLAQFGWYGISADAPHPNAAKLWIDFVFSKEGQQILADAGNIVTMPGLRVSNPDLTLQGKKSILLEHVPAAESDAFLKAFSAKYNLGFP